MFKKALATAFVAAIAALPLSAPAAAAPVDSSGKSFSHGKLIDWDAPGSRATPNRAIDWD